MEVYTSSRKPIVVLYGTIHAVVHAMLHDMMYSMCYTVLVHSLTGMHTSHSSSICSTASCIHAITYSVVVS